MEPGDAPFDASTQRYNRVVEEQLDVAWRVARRSGVPVAYVDDVLQEAFLIVVAKLSRIAPAAERAFVASVTLRVSANWRRSRKRRPEDPVGGLDDLPALPAPVFSDAERVDGLNLLRKALDDMTDEQRETFVLVELEQLTVPETCRQLGLGEAAVTSRLRRARDVFRRRCAAAEESPLPVGALEDLP